MHLLRFTSSSSLNCTIPPSRCVSLELAFSFSFSFSYVSFSLWVPQIFKSLYCKIAKKVLDIQSALESIPADIIQIPIPLSSGHQLEHPYISPLICV
ncbi:hypothetical protein ACN42_g6203 [Penicillium freii]|uniref:Uncharacterized protein n=1 Tax=Penicillium freii TaxID=48697 RepID=A0A117NNJ0_PENFR|nr:hypothetical protein ACN42_g6203 [Penicillium freii]